MNKENSNSTKEIPRVLSLQQCQFFPTMDNTNITKSC
uniref:Uncharacterized protein n=1 Tax=Rhizophora mucronata TaxID=61149 RepID=A0A2P2IUB8_RHIMU